MTKEPDRLSEQVYQVLRAKYQEMDDSNAIAISPAVLAERAYRELDPRDVSPTLVRWGCIMELRQMGRSLCRRRVEEEEERVESGEGDMFSGLLQDRYPAHRAEGEVYVLRAHLSATEYDYNIARLRREGQAKLQHANALEAEKERRVALGLLGAAA